MASRKFAINLGASFTNRLKLPCCIALTERKRGRKKTDCRHFEDDVVLRATHAFEKMGIYTLTVAFKRIFIKIWAHQQYNCPFPEGGVQCRIDVADCFLFC
jgi:hypothetical protein